MSLFKDPFLFFYLVCQMFRFLCTVSLFLLVFKEFGFYMFQHCLEHKDYIFIIDFTFQHFRFSESSLSNTIIFFNLKKFIYLFE